MAVAFTAVIAVMVVAVRPFVWPTDDAPFPDGPIVVLGGGAGERLAAGLAIRREDRDRPLIVSASAIDDWRDTGGRCTPEEVVCLTPEPVNTFGEAVTVSRLVDEQGWGHITVVTSDFHVTRTRWLFDRCVGVPVRVVGAPTDPGVGHRIYLVTREMTAMVVAVVRRACA